jgi:signal peptidase II
LVVAGGLGNLIDRVRQGFVVDYLDFSALFGFPVFNLADCCVVVGTILLLIYVFRLEYREKKRGKR